MYETPPKPPWLSEPSPVERLRDCWVTADEHGRVPALLLEWRDPTGWEGRVVRPVLDMEDQKWPPREEWLLSSASSSGELARPVPSWLHETA